MISKETFCRAMRLRDKQFKKTGQLEMLIGQIFDCDTSPDFDNAFVYTETALFLVLEEVMGDRQQIIRRAVLLEASDIEDEDEDYVVYATASDGTEVELRDYEAIYDFLIAGEKAAAKGGRL